MKQSNVLIVAGGGGPAEPVLSKAWAGYRTTKMRKALSAFTMAEILLSLTIIGVVAAITLPSLTGNINERTWNTQRKALYARMSQAIALMPALNGYGVLKEESSAGASDAEDTAAETFVTDGLSKVLKINNICDGDHLEDCGITPKFTDMTGSIAPMPKTLTELNPAMTSVSFNVPENIGLGIYSAINSKAAAFETQNGESILLFYNPTCSTLDVDVNRVFVQPKICANLIYDLNGNKGPNTAGKDIGFMTFLSSVDTVVAAPVPNMQKYTGIAAEDVSSTCTTRAGDDYRTPTKEEAASLFVNKNIIGGDWSNGHLWTSSKVVRSDYITAWVMVMEHGEYRVPVKNATWELICVKR